MRVRCVIMDAIASGWVDRPRARADGEGDRDGRGWDLENDWRCIRRARARCVTTGGVGCEETDVGCLAFDVRSGVCAQGC